MTLRTTEQSASAEHGAKEEHSLPDAEELSGSGTEGDVGAGVEVDGGLAQHGVVLNLGAAEGRAVSGDENELGCKPKRNESEDGSERRNSEKQLTLSGAHALEGGLVSERVLSGLDRQRQTGVDCDAESETTSAHVRHDKTLE